jgi:DNA polymerase-3 subunit delta'
VRFRDVEHQERALSIVRRALRSGRMPHAYLFEGPEGVGKELTARALAARLLCEADVEPDADACGACRACRLVAGGNHPDLHVIERRLHKLHPDRAVRTSKGLFLAVDLIRHFLIEPAASKPSLGGRRVFVIREAERMNEGAQNALLKTLEEPPGQSCLILVSAAAERLLPTIRSRCQRVPFGLLPPDFIERHLVERCGVKVEAARALALLADGRLGAAVQWQRCGMLTALDEVGASLDELENGGPSRFAERLIESAGGLGLRSRGAEEPAEAEAGAVEDDGAEAEAAVSGSAKSLSTDELRTALKLVFMLVAMVYREALVVRAGVVGGARLASQERRAAALAGRQGVDEIEGSIRAVQHAERLLDQNVAPVLVCERLAIGLLGEVPV